MEPLALLACTTTERDVVVRAVLHRDLRRQASAPAAVAAAFLRDTTRTRAQCLAEHASKRTAPERERIPVVRWN